MTRPTVNPGAVIWSGEHWIDYLRRPGEQTNSGGERSSCMFALSETMELCAPS